MIAGVVESVRMSGDVICTSLLNAQKHVKALEVFKARNVLVSKSDALKVAAVYKQHKDPKAARKAARAEAVKLVAQYFEQPKQLKIPPSLGQSVRRMVGGTLGADNDWRAVVSAAIVRVDEAVTVLEYAKRRLVEKMATP
jgi:hypothetical protein